MADLKNLKSLSPEELKDKLFNSRKKIMDFQVKRKSGLDKPHQYRSLKKDIAQILTVLGEKRRQGAKKVN